MEEPGSPSASASSEPTIDDQFLLELSSKRIDFQPVSKDVSVFYDESNRQVFIVINRGAEGIIVKGSDDLTLKFRYNDSLKRCIRSFSHSLFSF